MVKSTIHPDKINYNESKQVDDEDVGYAGTRYELSGLDTPFEITLGKEKHTYSSHDIVYFPIYFIHDNSIHSRIGIVEIESNDLLTNTDEDGDFDINRGKIVMFVDNEYIQRVVGVILTQSAKVATAVSVSDSDSDSDSDTEILNIEGNIQLDDVESLDDVTSVNIPSEKRSIVSEKTDGELKDGIFELMDPMPSIETLSEENKESAQQIKLKYTPSSKQLWVQKFMKNTNYNIVDNEGSGDCLFAVIRDAYQQIGKKTSVEKLRALLSNEANEETFLEYRMLYNGFDSHIQEIESEMKKLKKVSRTLKSRSNNSISKDENKQLLNQASSVVDNFKELASEKKETTQLLSEFKHMKDITNLDEFKEFIKTRHYWADTWAVSTLERLLNVKIVILMETPFKNGDLDSVLSCGQLNDNELESLGGFKPDFYIMTSYTDNHYTLITYKDKHILKFNEVPYDIKSLIINKCMERNAGPYYLIQDMRNFKAKLGLDLNEGAPVKDDNEYINMDLYDNDNILMFHSNSNSQPKPGKGSGEKIKDVNIMDFIKLSKISNWRKKLDDSWSAPFQVDGHRWNSVEHYYLGAQFKKGFPDFYLQFSLDKDSEISKDIALARIAGSKSGKVKDNVLRDKKIVIDPDFYQVGVSPRKTEERLIALDAKFSQNLDLRQVLIETKRSKLVKFIRGREPETDISLMKIRHDIPI
jgi:predicted NAD-dependent protein-ADP-ribosyltransferase YbiA (DUF1768 family)